MRSPLLRWLLDLDAIPPDATGLRLGWEHPLPPWAWALIILAVVALSAWSYARLRGSAAMRVALATLRTALLLLLVALLCGPLLVLPRERVERDWVLVLLDRSASMEIADAPAQGGRRRTRDAQLRAALEAAAPALRRLAEERQVLWLGFDGGAFELAAATEGADEPASPDDARSAQRAPVELGPADGWRTRLGPAIEQALQRAAARPLAGVVVLSDGRTVDPPSRALVRRLQAEAVPVYVAPLGAEAAVGDLAVRRVSAPERAFTRDFVPVTVEVDRLGEAATELPATVRLVDMATGAELDSAELPVGGETASVTLTGGSEAAGEARWAVVVVPAGEDLVAENNRRELAIGLVDRPLRVLYVEGYPRWEYHYLKDLLVREDSIESSVMLLSADRDFAQEGDLPLARLPRTPEEFAEFDLVIIGDVPASYFIPEQLQMIREAVSTRGTGLLWIGGAVSTPSAWAGTALADLLPMRTPLDLPTIGAPVNMAPTEAAAALGVLRLEAAEALEGWPPELSDPAAGWSRLHWAQRIEPSQLKPAVEVLAESVQAPSGGAMPLVMTMRYGAGQSVYVATDEIWRWRFGRGELLPQQFWVQLVRFLGRERIAGADSALSLEVEPRRATPGQPVRLMLRITDAALAALNLPSVAAAVDVAEGGAPDGEEGTAGERVAEIDLRPTGRPGEYGATWVPETVGARRLRVIDPALPEAAAESGEFVVLRPDEERRRPETDHALLRTLAAETGGRVLAPEELAAINDLPRREIRTEDPVTERIWNTPLALLLVVLLATLEWIGRRLINLI